MSGRPYAEVIGDPIAHSKSPLIHNFWLARLGIDAEYRACHVRPGELADYFTRRRGDAEWVGCNVTMPHKEAVMNFADGMETKAWPANAANLIKRRGDRLYAANTDVHGIGEPLSRFPLPLAWTEYDPAGPATAAICKIVGAGGAASAAIDAAMDAGYLSTQIYNRSVAKARDFAARVGVARVDVFGLEELCHAPLGPDHPYQGYDCRFLIINASPMGMAGQPEVPIDLAQYPPETIVFDMVYAPVETALLRQARDCGLRTIDGLEMLVAQAAAAFELFFGQPAPREHDAELRALLTA